MAPVSQSLCDYEESTDGKFKCVRCGDVRAFRVKRACAGDRAAAHAVSYWWGLIGHRTIPWHDDDTGLGDFLAHKLDSSGVTKARWLKFAKQIGAVPKDAKTCGCEARQAELNRRFPRA